MKSRQQPPPTPVIDLMGWDHLSSAEKARICEIDAYVNLTQAFLRPLKNERFVMLKRARLRARRASRARVTRRQAA